MLVCLAVLVCFAVGVCLAVLGRARVTLPSLDQGHAAAARPEPGSGPDGSRTLLEPGLEAEALLEPGEGACLGVLPGV